MAIPDLNHVFDAVQTFIFMFLLLAMMKMIGSDADW